MHRFLLILIYVAIAKFKQFANDIDGKKIQLGNTVPVQQYFKTDSLFFRHRLRDWIGLQGLPPNDQDGFAVSVQGLGIVHCTAYLAEQTTFCTESRQEREISPLFS